MKRLNKASKIFILTAVVLALSVMFSCVAFGADANVVENYSDGAEPYADYIWNIRYINIVNSFDGITDQGVIKAWDVSENSDSGVVKAWLKVDSAVLPQLAEEESEIVLPHDVRCELFIGAEGGVKAPADMKGFFAEFENLEKITGFENLDTSAVTNMQGMFAGCSSLKTLDLSGLKTENVTDMSFMFRGCSSLEEITLDNFNTEKVTHMAYMFADCVKLPEIYVDSFNTKAVRDAQYMFFNCQKLVTIYVGDNWLFINIESSSNMFKNCYLLEGKKAYDPARTDAAYASTEYYTVHVSILNGDPVVLKVMDNLYVGQEKPVPEYIGYHYFNMIESFESSAPDVVYVNDKGDFVAAGVGRAHITAKLKENINGEITFTFSVEEKVIEAPEGVSLLSDILEVIKGWFNTIMEKIKSIFSFSF